jgi:hypothetical protein
VFDEDFVWGVGDGDLVVVSDDQDLLERAPSVDLVVDCVEEEGADAVQREVSPPRPPDVSPLS